MSAERDKFGREELVEVLSHYDVGVISSAKEYPRGSRRSPKLILETPDGRYLLKRRARGKDDLLRVAFAHALVEHIRKKGLPVPALIKTCDEGTTLLELGNHVYELYAYVDGERCNDSLEETMRAGETLARFHQAVADFSMDWTPPATSYHHAPNVRAGLNAIPTVTSGHDSVAGHEAELLYLTQALHEEYDRMAELVNRAGFASWPIAIIHGDWHPGNMLFRDGTVCAIVDFDAARHQPRIIDVAYGMLQFSILRGAATPEQWPDFFDETRMRRFLSGYLAVEPIPGEQRRVVTALMIEALIAEAAVPIAVTGSFGPLPGLGVLQMVSRKIRWLQENAKRMQRWLLE